MIQPLDSLNKLVYKRSQNEGQCFILQIDPIQFSMIKFIIYLIISICLVGFPFLIVFWYPQLKRKFYFRFCSLSEATDFFIKNSDNEYTYAEKIQESYYPTQSQTVQVISFVNRYMKYIIQDNLAKAVNFDFKSKIRNIMKNQIKGLDKIQVQRLRATYGSGTMIIQRPYILVLFFREVFRPLYLFILFSISLWIYEKYYYYAGVIFVTSAIAIGINLVQVRQLNQKFFHMANYNIPVNVLRENEIVNISSDEIVPGDIVFLKDQIKIPFEGIILEGSALINQCALTGQSNPHEKKADLLQFYLSSSHQIDKSSFVKEGQFKKKMQKFEQMRQSLGFGIPVCVIGTNFNTLNGQIIRRILFQKQQENLFQRQSTKFLIFLFCLSVITYCILIIKIHAIVSETNIIVKFLDLITITVPPGLSISMTCGIIFAIQKLKDKKIFCISPNKVISGGSANFACFDKTGTLTEDNMDFYGLVPVRSQNFQTIIQATPQLQNVSKPKIQDILKEKPYILTALGNMASNHSIIQIQKTGKPVGDPMQIKLLQFGEFRLDLSHNDPDVKFSFFSQRKHNGIIYKRFQFDSDLQRMSVICKNSAFNNDNYVYSKGSPQIMFKIMNLGSIPSNYNQNLKKYTSHGFRVLAISSRKIDGDIKNVSRKQAQSNLNFDGFQVFQNKLKKQTYVAIQQLKQSGISCVMITGDNALTGSNISFKCGIADTYKKMIICDYKKGKYKNGKYQTEDFIFSSSNKEKKENYQNKHLVQKKQLNEEEPQSSFKINLKKNTQQIQMKICSSQLQKHKAMKTQNQFSKNKQNGQEDFITNIMQRIKQENAQICLTGSAFNNIFKGNFDKVDQKTAQFVKHISVFARAQPNDKARIVSLYQNLEKIVIMCGDGANDCEALKQADIGLSLSQTQASISAPFNSKIKNISAVVELVKQCRASLATNFSLFNIMALYSLIQYSTTIIVEFFYAYPSDFHYLYWDVGCNFFFFLTIGYTQTEEKISKHIPNSRLFSITNVFQVLFMFGIQLLGQICMILALSGVFQSQTKYNINGGEAVNEARYAQEGDFIKDTPETNILFLFSNFMYIFSLLAFTISTPWRKQFYTNIPFVIVLVVILTYSILITVVPVTRIPDFFISWMNHININFFVLGMSFAFGIFIYVMQKCVWELVAQKLRESYPQKQYL